VRGLQHMLITNALHNPKITLYYLPPTPTPTPTPTPPPPQPLQKSKLPRTSEVIHFLCPLQLPSCFPSFPSQRMMVPSMSPLAMIWASGDQETTSTQLRWPWWGGWVRWVRWVRWVCWVGALESVPFPPSSNQPPPNQSNQPPEPPAAAAHPPCTRTAAAAC